MHVNEASRSRHPADALKLLRQGTAEHHRRIERQPLVRQLLSRRLTVAGYGDVLAAFRAWYAGLEAKLLRSGCLGSIGAWTELSRFGEEPVRPTCFIQFQHDELARRNPESGFTDQYVYVSRHDRLDRDLAVVDALSLARGLTGPSVVTFSHGDREAVPAVDSRLLTSRAASGVPVQRAAHSVVIPSVTTIGEMLGVLYVIEGSTQGGRIIAPRVEALLGLEPGHGTSFFRLFAQGYWPAFQALTRAWLDEHEVDLAVTAARRTFSSLHAHLDAWNERLARTR